MRDYALNRSLAAESIGASLVTLYGNWRDRREVAKLARYGDKQLRDLGVSRDDVHWAMRQPLSQNARLALEELVFKRARC